MEKQKKVTIREVAARAGVSISSVSRYLADPKSVQPLAAYNIKNAITDLKYSPNSFAQNLKRGNSRLIGILVPHIEFFFGKVCAVVSDYFYERGYVTFFCESDNDGTKERFFLQSLENQQAAGIIVVPSGQNTPFLEGIAREHGNMVVLDRGEDIGCDVISADHEHDSYLLTGFILDRHSPEDVIVLLGPEAASSTRFILQGMNRAFEERRLDFSRAGKVYNCRNLDILTGAVKNLYEQIDGSRRPIIFAMGEEFLENAAVILNQYGRTGLKRVVLTGFAMPDAFEKLGINLPCIIRDPKSAGIVAAEVLYKKISGNRNGDEPPRTYGIQVTYRLNDTLDNG